MGSWSSAEAAGRPFIVEGEAFLGELPMELMLHIFSYLNGTDLARLSQVSRGLSRACSHPSLWRNLFLERWSYMPPAYPQIDNWKLIYSERNRLETLWLRSQFSVKRWSHTSNLTAIDLDDKLLVVASWDNTVMLRRPGSLSEKKTTQDVSTLRGHSSPVWDVLLTKDVIVSASRDKTLRVWGRDGIHRTTLHGHTAPVSKVDIMPNGQLVSGSYDGTVRRWDIETGQQLASSWAGGTAEIERDNAVWSMQADTEHAGVVVAGLAMTTVNMLDFRVPAASSSASSPSGGAAATPSPSSRGSGSGGGSVPGLADAAQVTRTMAGHTDPVSSVSFDNSGRLASGSYDASIRLWDLGTGGVIRQIAAHTAPVASVQLHQGKLVSGGYDHLVKIWTMSTGLAQRVFTEHTGWVFDVVLRPGIIVSAGNDGMLVYRQVTDKA